MLTASVIVEPSAAQTEREKESAFDWTRHAAQARFRQKQEEEQERQQQQQLATILANRNIFHLTRDSSDQIKTIKTLDELEANMRPVRSALARTSSRPGSERSAASSAATAPAGATSHQQQQQPTTTTRSSSATSEEEEEEEEELQHLRKSMGNRGLGAAWSPAGRHRRRAAAGPSSPHEKDKQQQQQGGCLFRLCQFLWRLSCFLMLLLLLNVAVYWWPLDERYQFEAQVTVTKPRPKFEGALAKNDALDKAEKLWEGQFHGPESMAWTADRRAFFTGVEGGFILFVEPYAERWTIAAQLNARNSVQDLSGQLTFDLGVNTPHSDARGPAINRTASSDKPTLTPFCKHDTELYGRRAEFEPSWVRISRCSRPLGIRLSPDESRLYVMDPLSGLYQVQLLASLSGGKPAGGDSLRPLAKLNKVTRLIDMSQNQLAPDADFLLPGRPKSARDLHFGDDIAVEWRQRPDGTPDDLVYMSDCSRRWPLRYLLWLMLENDASGRILQLEVAGRRLRSLPLATPPPLNGLSFPNGLELTASGDALLLSDLNNRRILKRHLRGPQAGDTELVMSTPGFSDNIRRGLDQPDGTPTYWYACGCAVGDGRWELLELANEHPRAKLLAVRWLHLLGSGFTALGRWLGSPYLQDVGLMADAGWLKLDPYCTHGLVAQFDESGKLLRSLHGPSFSSNFKLISEAHQVALIQPPTSSSSSSAGGENSTARANKSALYLGSVYYEYLGRLELDD